MKYAYSEQQLLDQLIDDFGFESEEELIQQALMDGTSGGICTQANCGYTTDVEPDQDQGWCEMCHTNTVISGCILAGVI
jgi:hypothetical protein